MHLETTPASLLWHSLRDEVRHNNGSGRVVIAVDGFDGAGKATFADNLALVWQEEDLPVFRASIDGFHRPRAERYERGRHSPEGFYRDSFDYATFRRVLLDPFRMGTGAGFQLAAFDVTRDQPVESEWHSAPKDATLIVDGVFLHRPELRAAWNWSVWLDVPADIAIARMARRDGTNPDPRHPSNARYRNGQAIYLADADPRRAADAIVDNTDPDHPRRVYSDYC